MDDKSTCIFNIKIWKSQLKPLVGSQPQTRNRANGQGSALSASQPVVALSTLFPSRLHQIELLLHCRRRKNQTGNSRM